MRLLSFLTLAVFLSIWSACQKSDFDNPDFVEHSAEYAFPLFNTELSLEDLMGQILNDSVPGDTLLIHPDGSMTLYYSGDVAQKPATDIFKSFTGGAFPLTDTLTAAPFDTIAGVTITHADLKKGRFGISVLYNYQPFPISCTVKVPQMTTPTGEVFSHSFVIPALGNYVSPILDVTNHKLRSDNNKLEYVYDARLPDGTRTKVEAFPGIPSMIVQFDSLEFTYLQGYWGYTEYPLTRDTIEIEINQTDLKGDVTIQNPRVRMRIQNSWGFPTRGVVKTLVFMAPNGDTVALSNSVFPTGYVDFAYPSFAAGEVGQTKYTDIYLDETNSNIAEIFKLQPTRLIYDLAGIANANQDPDIIGFITDESIISLNMQVVLDLVGSVRNFGAEQTLDLNFGDYGDLDTASIEEVEFKLVTENGTPISANLQLYFQDEAGATLDSLFTGGPQNLLNASPIGADGTASGATRTEHFIKMPISRFDRIRKAKKAFLQTSFTTAEGGEKIVKLLAQNSAVVKMGVKIRKKVF